MTVTSSMDRPARAKRPQLKGLLIASLLSVSGTIVVACGGGGSGSSPSTVVPAATPTPQQSVTGSFTPLANSATTAPLPPVGDYSGSVVVPPASVQGTVSVQTSLVPPSGVAGLQFRHAAALAAAAASDTPLLYLTLSAASVVTFTGFPAFTISLPASAGSGPFYLAELESGTWTTIAGPESPTNGSVTLQPAIASLTITPSAPAYFVLYTTGAVASPAPSSAPSVVPTTVPSAVVTPTPVGVPSATPTGVGVPSSSPSLAPTPTGHPSAVPTPFPSPSPTATPTTSANGTAPASFLMGTLPSANAGTAIVSQPISGFEVLGSGGAQINGAFSQAVTVTSSNAAVMLSVLGGAAPSSSVTLTSGSQLLALTYTGAAISPATIQASAPGATTNSATFAPAIQPIVYSGPTNASSGLPEIDLYAPSGGGAGSTFSFTVSQAGYTGSFGHAITVSVPSACIGFATVAPASGTTFTVAAPGAPLPGSCTLTLSGFGTTTLSVPVTYTTLGVTLH